MRGGSAKRLEKQRLRQSRQCRECLAVITWQFLEYRPTSKNRARKVYVDDRGRQWNAAQCFDCHNLHTTMIRHRKKAKNGLEKNLPKESSKKTD